LACQNALTKAQKDYDRVAAKIAASDHSPSPCQGSFSEMVVELSRFKAVRVLAQSATSVVELSKDTKTNREVAVKTFVLGTTFSSTAFLRESGVLHSLSRHPCIVELIGICIPSGKGGHTIITAYMSNGSLDSVLSGVKSGSAPSFWNHTNIAILVTGFVAGMRYVHKNHVIHRDLKPANLLIDGNGRLRIGDFGTCRLDDPTLSQTGGVGTCHYMSPEVIQGGVQTEKVDVFAFGLILYEIILGEKVFPGTNEFAIKQQIVSGTRPEIERGRIPVSLRNLIMRCWSARPEERPTFDEILENLDEVQFQIFRPKFDDVDASAVRRFISEVESIEARLH
jgi:serine/threonine-protein kinase TNNI3K